MFAAITRVGKSGEPAMWNVRWFSAASSLVVAAAGLASGQDKVEQKVAAKAAEWKPDPVGRWPKFEQGQKRRVHVWFEDEVWHLRCTCSKNDKSRFDGTVTADKGQIRVVGRVGNEPAFDKAGKVSNAKYVDYVQATPNGFAFLIRSSGKLDGIDFTAPKEAKTIRFQILVDRDPLAAYIFVGPKGEHPKEAEFVLDAHPK
jgi:hypothetical protein